MESVVLCHASSGTFLTDGTANGLAVRFDTEADAAAFCRRYLDEAAAWRAVAPSEPATAGRAA